MIFVRLCIKKQHENHFFFFVTYAYYKNNHHLCTPTHVLTHPKPTLLETLKTKSLAMNFTHPIIIVKKESPFYDIKTF